MRIPAVAAFRRRYFARASGPPWIAVLLVAALGLAPSGCRPAASGRSGGARTAVAAPAGEGVFSLLIYNVAGLPEPFSASRPATNTALMSPLLNRYDVVLVQEDFWYHDLLVQASRHPWRSQPMTGQSQLVNDGLNRFSFFPLDPVTRVAWRVCHGTAQFANDCLAPKGFSFGRLHLGDGLTIDLYNLHADAGADRYDIEARRLQFEQLRDRILAESAGRAVIAGGDTNLAATRGGDMVTLDRFLRDTGLVDVCRALGCRSDRIDRVLVRSGDRMQLRALGWRVADEFIDANAAPLSDHEAVHVDIGWRFDP